MFLYFPEYFFPLKSLSWKNTVVITVYLWKQRSLHYWITNKSHLLTANQMWRE